MFSIFNNYLTKNHLYKNSFFLITSSCIASVIGFLFWILIARLYSTDQIGLATSLSSIVNLIATFSLLGLNTGLIRFLPLSKYKNEQINSVLLIISAVSGIFALITLLNINLISNHLIFVKNNFYKF